MRVFAEDFQIGVAQNVNFSRNFLGTHLNFLAPNLAFLHLYVALRIGVVLNHLGTEEGN